MLIWQKYLKVLGQVSSILPSSTIKYQVLLNFKVSSTSKYQVLKIFVSSTKYKYFTWPLPWHMLHSDTLLVYTYIAKLLKNSMHGVKCDLFHLGVLQVITAIGWSLQKSPLKFGIFMCRGDSRFVHSQWETV